MAYVYVKCNEDGDCPSHKLVKGQIICVEDRIARPLLESGKCDAVTKAQYRQQSPGARSADDRAEMRAERKAAAAKK